MKNSSLNGLYEDFPRCKQKKILKYSPMKLSVSSEAIIKRALAENKEEHEIAEISRRIQELETGLGSMLQNDYLDVIEKCIFLEDLNVRVEDIAEANNHFFYSIQEHYLKQMALVDEHESISLSTSRAEILYQEISRIFQFLEMANEMEKNKDFYRCILNLKKMGKLLPLFSKYAFYVPLSKIYQSLDGKIFDMVEGKIETWVSKIDVLRIGQGIKAENATGIFDEITIRRRSIITKEFLQAAYASKQLNLNKFITGVINEKRKEVLNGFIFGKNTSSEDFLFVSMTYFLTNFYISEYFQGADSFSKEILDHLKNCEIKDINSLITARILMHLLRMDAENMDRIIEKAAFSHFYKNMSGENFVDGMRRYISECSSFLDAMSTFNGGLEELFARSLDKKLISRIEDGNTDGLKSSYLKRKDEISVVYENSLKIRPVLEKYPFEVFKIIQMKDSEVIESKYNSMVEDIGCANDANEAVEMVLSLKKFMDESIQEEIARKLLEHSDEILSGHSKDDLTLFRDTLKRNFFRKE